MITLEIHNFIFEIFTSTFIVPTNLTENITNKLYAEYEL